MIRNQDYKLHVSVIYSEGCLFCQCYIILCHSCSVVSCVSALYTVYPPCPIATKVYDLLGLSKSQRLIVSLNMWRIQGRRYVFRDTLSLSRHNIGNYFDIVLINKARLICANIVLHFLCFQSL